MKKVFITANWKSNKNSREIKDWFSNLSDALPTISSEEKEIIVCPSFVYLSLVSNLIEEKGLSFKVGAQDISQFDMGAYTGEVNANQLIQFAQYAIVGHSERRNLFGETDEIIAKKIEQGKAVGIEPILCVQDANTPIPGGVAFVAYEPPDAISTSGPGAHVDDPKLVREVARKIKEKNKDVRVLYGGSIDEKNIAKFKDEEILDGVLVGGASLDPLRFAQLIKNA